MLTESSGKLFLLHHGFHKCTFIESMKVVPSVRICNYPLSLTLKNFQKVVILLTAICKIAAVVYLKVVPSWIGNNNQFFIQTQKILF